MSFSDYDTQGTGDWQPFEDTAASLGDELFAVDAESFTHVLVHLKETYKALYSVVEGVRQDQLGQPFFKLIFDALDANNDGTVGREEASVGFTNAGLASSQAEIDAVFERYDTNHNNKIELEEFRLGLISTVSNRFAQVISPFVPDKRVLLRTGCLTVLSPEDENALDPETVQVMLTQKVQECADLCAVLEKVGEDTASASRSITQFLTE